MYFKRIDTSKIYPPFLAKAQKLALLLEQNGAPFFAISGLRTVEEQNALYAQGRTAPGKIVTNAKGGQSWHNFGAAIDFCADADAKREGLQPDWNAKAYKPLADGAKNLGLEPGLFWKFVDAPHVQMPMDMKGISLAACLKVYQVGGLAGVWKLFDAKGPW